MTCTSKAQPVRTVSNVDLSRYVGKMVWDCILSSALPEGCHHCTTAEYTMSDEGYVIVENRCRKDSIHGKKSYIKGKAFVEPNSGNAKLKVQFLSQTGFCSQKPIPRQTVFKIKTLHFVWFVSIAPLFLLIKALILFAILPLTTTPNCKIRVKGKYWIIDPRSGLLLRRGRSSEQEIPVDSIENATNGSIRL